MKTALITGIPGQDGSFLAEFLLEKGYEVHGTIRRSSVDYRERIAHLEGRPHFHLHYADLGDSMSLIQVVGKVRPDEIYNLAAQSHVQVSFDAPEFTADVDATGVLRILEAVRQCGLAETCRIYQASTSELYGKVEQVPQNEQTPFHPYSPYAVAKLYGFWIVKEYREAYNMFCCSGILFNHESERRGETFVTRKITLAAARIAQGKQEKLYLGNLSSLRDWGYAKDYVECMWLILQNDKPEDFVIATGVQHSVREFCQLAFHHVGIELDFVGEGCARKFAKEGWNLILNARTVSKLEELKAELEKEYGIQVYVLPFDVRDRKQAAAALEALPEEWKSIDVLINNAGLVIGVDKEFEGSLDEWDIMIDTNIRGLLAMTRLVVPGMVERGCGHIINIGSIAGDAAYPGGSVYCATKAAVKALSDGLRIDLVDTPLRVTNIKPGMVETNFTVVRYRGDKQAADNFYKGIRPLTGDDIAETVYYAASAPAHIQIAEVLLMPTYQATGTISYKKKAE